MRETEFEQVYRQDPDPFRVARSWYEQRKQGVVLAALASSRYRLGWDVASGTGHLAEALARRCDRVIASDASPRAVELTAHRTAGSTHVVSVVNRLPDVAAGASSADLVVIAEVLYYLPEVDRAAVVERVAATDAEVVMVHWRHLPHDAWLSGADVHEESAAAWERAGRTQRVHHVDRDFVLDTWTLR